MEGGRVGRGRRDVTYCPISRLLKSCLLGTKGNRVRKKGHLHTFTFRPLCLKEQPPVPVNRGLEGKGDISIALAGNQNMIHGVSIPQHSHYTDYTTPPPSHNTRTIINRPLLYRLYSVLYIQSAAQVT
jgi:hypothetical protein